MSNRSATSVRSIGSWCVAHCRSIRNSYGSHSFKTPIWCGWRVPMRRVRLLSRRSSVRRGSRSNEPGSQRPRYRPLLNRPPESSGSCSTWSRDCGSRRGRSRSRGCPMKPSRGCQNSLRQVSHPGLRCRRRSSGSISGRCNSTNRSGGRTAPPPAMPSRSTRSGSQWPNSSGTRAIFRSRCRCLSGARPRGRPAPDRPTGREAAAVHSRSV